MNSLLFDRSTGNLPHRAFARIANSRLVSSVGPAPHLRFDGGERGTAPPPVPSGPDADAALQRTSLWAHRSGVNTLVLDRFEGRM